MSHISHPMVPQIMMMTARNIRVTTTPFFRVQVDVSQEKNQMPSWCQDPFNINGTFMQYAWHCAQNYPVIAYNTVDDSCKK